MKLDFVYIYSHFPFTLKSAGVSRMLYYARALAEKGTTVYLIGASDLPLVPEKFLQQSENIYVHEQKELAKGLLNTIAFVRRLWKFAKVNGGLYSFLYYPTPLVYLELISIFYLKHIRKERVYMELNEIRKYSASFQEPYSLNKPFYSLKKWVFSRTFSAMEANLHHFNGLICISKAISDYGRKYNPNILRIPILTDPNCRIMPSDENFSDPEKFNIGFSGSVHLAKERLDGFLQVLCRLKKSGYTIQFNVCGLINRTNKKQILGEILPRLDLEDTVKYYGALDQENLSAFLSQQDLLVIPRGYTLQNHYGFSTKLSDYLNHEKPVLLTDVSDNSLYIKDGINGFIVPPDDDDAMFNKISWILENYELCAPTVVRESRKTSFQHFYYKNYAEKLQSFLIQ